MCPLRPPERPPDRVGHFNETLLGYIDKNEDIYIFIAQKEIQVVDQLQISLSRKGCGYSVLYLGAILSPGYVTFRAAAQNRWCRTRP